MELRGISKLDLKRRNRAQILKVIRECGPISRVDIASSMKITRAAVTIITNEMIEEGVLYEVGEAPVSIENLQKGRRKILIDINENFKFALGASISDKRVTVGLTNINTKILDNACMDLSDTVTSESIIDYIVSASKTLISNSGLDSSKILGIGIGVHPDMCSKMKIYMKDGKLDYSYLTEKISGELSIPVSCANLASALALANQDECVEDRKGNYVLLMHGRHMNMSVLIGNEVMTENLYHTNHVENVIVNPGGRRISGYPDGSVKAELTTIAFAEKQREVFSKDDTPILWEIANGSLNNVHTKTISAAAAKGEAKTVEVVNNYCRCLCTLVNNLSTTFFANHVILHGFEFDDWMYDYFKNMVLTLCGDELTRKVKISRTENEKEFAGGVYIVIEEQFYLKGGISNM